MASISSERTRGQKTLSEGLVVIPIVAADFATTDSWIYQITVVNVTGGSLTFSILDKQSIPKGMTAVPVAANTVYVMPWPEGLKMRGGINWVASGTGLQAEIFGFQL